MMNSVNERNPRIDAGAMINDQFREFSARVDANQYDRVFSFFKSRFASETPAASFTAELFRVAEVNQLSIDILLAEFKKSPNSQISALLAYYLNTARDKSTYLGVSSRLIPPVGVARNVRA